jgi:hypothetical protein
MQRLGTARARIVLVAAIGVLAAPVAGCARPVTSPGADVLPGAQADSFGEGRSGMPVGVDCESDGTAVASPPPMTSLASGAVLVSARRCVFQPELVPGDGEWLMRVEQEATSGLEALAAALRLPNEPTSAGRACDLVAYAPIVITVTDSAGRKFHPAVPQTACGAPHKEVVDAITAMPWTTVATSKARQMRSELEISSGCSGSWKPEIPLIAAEGSGTQTSTVDTTVGPLRVCRYQADPDPANIVTVNDGSAYRIGVLTSASTLDAAASGRLLTALQGAPPVVFGNCAQPEHPFAVVYPPDRGGPDIVIELSGCYRALLGSENYLRQLDAATVAPLLG